MIDFIMPTRPDLTKKLSGTWVDDWNSVSTASYSGYRRGFSREQVKKKWLEPNQSGRSPFNVLTKEVLND